MLDKKQVVVQLKQAASLLELLGEDPFRAKAFLNASQQLDSFKGSFLKLYEEKRLEEIKGIGKSLATEIYTMEKGSLHILEELISQVPRGVLELFSVAGLGAKKIRQLWHNDIDSLEKLVQAGTEGTLANLKGFGAKSTENLTKAAKFALKAQNRFRLDEATVIAEQFVGVLKRKLPKARIEIAGDLRRGCETIGEINIVLTNINFTQIETTVREFTELEFTEKELKEPVLKFNYLNYPFKIIVAEPHSFGAVLALWTGNSSYGRNLLKRVEEKGFKLSVENGLQKNNKILDTSDEKAFFKYLDLPLIVPELRESASPKVINNLIEDKDIHGLIHNHTTWSDGEHNISEMVNGALAKGYRYLGLADHSVTLAIANGLSSERIYAQAQEIKRIRQSLRISGKDFGILHGIEVDILTDGSLAYTDEVLATLDYTVISVHQNFSLSRKEQTQRIIKAVNNPYANILAHPTGRLLLRRPAYELDIDAVLEACAASGTIIEINANPHRLDLDWRYITKAKELGCKFSINPDAHRIDGYNVMPFGVKIARKGGLTKADVVNTAPSADEFLEWIKR